MRRCPARDLAFALSLVAVMLYGAVFIAHTSYVVDGRRVFCLFDDAMVSLTYARHLARGDGLVWVPGQRVEGFTNPLWVGLMALSQRVWSDPLTSCLPLQLLSLGCLLGALVELRRLARRLGLGDVAMLGAVLLTGSYLPLVNYALQGMEVGLLAWLVIAACRLAVEVAAGRDASRLGWLLGVATLVRLDALLPAVVILGWLAWQCPHRRREVARQLALVLGFLAVQSLARRGYYGEWLPNTYFLKMTGCPLPPRLAHGAWAAAGFVAQTNVILVALAAGAPWLIRGPQVPVLPHGPAPRGPRVLWLLLALLAGQLSYSVWVGGDVWEWWGGANRYVAIAMPGFLLSLAAAWVGVVDRLIERLARRSAQADPVGQRLFRTVLAGLLLAGSAALLNVGRGSQPQVALREWLLLAPPVHVTENREHTVAGRVIAEFTTPDATVAVGWAGALPWFADRPGVDLLGKCDAHIARLPVHLDRSRPVAAQFLPGHMKWDYAWSLGRLRPDVIAQLAFAPSEAEPYLADYVQVQRGPVIAWVRRDSPRIRWDRVTPWQP